MSHEHDGVGTKYRAPYLGEVLSNADPAKRGRVKLTIPGLIQESDWVPAVGAPGGGTSCRGWYAPPAVGAKVVVWFLGGDVECPIFVPGPAYGPAAGPAGGYAPPTADGSPGADPGVSPEDAPQVWALETARWVLILDDREASRSFRLEDKRTGDHLLFNAANNAVDIKATANLFIRCDGGVTIDAGRITVGDRVLQKNGRPLLCPSSNFPPSGWAPTSTPPTSTHTTSAGS